MIVAGIDEAGKGPVIGPMVICLFEIEKEKEGELRRIGVRDSKLLTPARREQLYEELKKIGKWYLKVIPATEIDARVGYRTLNELETEKMAELIEQSAAEHITIDSIESNGENFGHKVQRLLKRKVAVLAEPKADVNHPVVSAASIVAKTVREQEVAKLKEFYGDFGSGYPHDPITVNFLEKWHKENKFFPPMVRKSWWTIAKRENERKQRKLGDF